MLGGISCHRAADVGFVWFYFVVSWCCCCFFFSALELDIFCIIYTINQLKCVPCKLDIFCIPFMINPLKCLCVCVFGRISVSPGNGSIPSPNSAIMTSMEVDDPVNKAVMDNVLGRLPTKQPKVRIIFLTIFHLTARVDLYLYSFIPFSDKL